MGVPSAAFPVFDRDGESSMPVCLVSIRDSVSGFASDSNLVSFVSRSCKLQEILEELHVLWELEISVAISTPMYLVPLPIFPALLFLETDACAHADADDPLNKRSGCGEFDSEPGPRRHRLTFAVAAG